MAKFLDYKKELETAAKSTILIHDPKVLIKLIIRMIVRKIEVLHAGIFLYDRKKSLYILTASKGKSQLKLPAGFLSVRKTSPLIRFFVEDRWDLWGKKILIYKNIKNALKRTRVKKDPEIFNFYKRLKELLEIYQSTACIPSFFRKELIALLILGKKLDNTEFTEEELEFLEALASDVAMSVRNAQLFEDLLSQVEKHRKLFYSVVQALVEAIDAKDRYTRGHTQRVTQVSLRIAEELLKDKRRKFSPNFLENLKIAALLHDIGKIGISESILNKNGKLTSKEREEIEKHPNIGASILEPIEELKEVIEGVKYHHERYDGKGYPEKLKRKKIPLIAAIISCADAYDAMSTDRPYRKALTKEEICKEFILQKGKQFHPQIANIVVRLIKKNKI